MRVHYLQHVAFEGPGYINAWLDVKGFPVSATHFYKEDFRLPSVADIDALIIMGGPMGVYDEERYPWLKVEKAFVCECIRLGKAVLGICLGAQLLAACLGAAVTSAEHKEIGWYKIFPTRECRNITWFYELFADNPTVFHWHGDQFAIPAGSHNLLVSDANKNQAFLYKDHVLGLQFHLETEEASIAGMLDHCAGDFDKSAFVQSPEFIRTQTGNAVATNILMRKLLEKFFLNA
ncbi:type 1 glutamine amidotransferase [Pedobacter sp. SYP-B3415]|uniref:type 1 glutamine amidotransferase n=1 Tax=Pedobacter sp. SYP-B3415 TaxID=2496641 RepID=UPI00101D1901|nr:type 1 glutamine amidotransferase [Pedobacter sp. SYP-B3415]